MNRYIITWTIGCSMFLMSCSNWLNVEPSDRVTEEKAFSTVAGFKKALNGVYVELNSSELYGRALTTEMVEVLAMRYDVNEENKINLALMNHDYTGASVLQKLEGIWGKAYNLIANTNLIIKNCETNRLILPDDYYRLIKGEALALRGMLHFDLFRLFGPVYQTDSTIVSIPYYKEFSLNLEESERGNEFMKSVLSDLKLAEELLSDDPILNFGVAGDKQDVFKQYRNLRLNYYAVKLLQARAYLYANNPAAAKAAALEVIKVQGDLFPFVKGEDINASNENPDRMFSTELVFALQNTARNSIYYGLFDPSGLKLKEILAPLADVIRKGFYNYTDDYRYKSWLSEEGDLNGVLFKDFVKYLGKEGLRSEVIPMMRVTEAFLIAGETQENSVEGNKEAMVYFNQVANARSIENNRYANYNNFRQRLNEIYYREFWGEGQLWFFYKRLNYKELISPKDFYSRVDIKPGQYVLPIPDAENKYN